MKFSKKIITLVTSMILINSISIPTYADNYLMGDVNHDGKISTMDLLLSKLFVLGEATLSQDSLKALDTNLDGKCNALDILDIKQMVLNLKTPIEYDDLVQTISGNITLNENTSLIVDGRYNPTDITDSYINLDTQTTEDWSLQGSINSSDTYMNYYTPSDTFSYCKDNTTLSVSNIEKTDYLLTERVDVQNGDGFKAIIGNEKFSNLETTINLNILDDKTSSLNIDVKNSNDDTISSMEYNIDPNSYFDSISKIYNVGNTTVNLNDATIVQRDEYSIKLKDNVITFNDLTNVEFSFNDDVCSYIVKQGEKETTSQVIEATQNAFQLDDNIVYVTLLNDNSILVQITSSDNSSIMCAVLSIEDTQMIANKIYFANGNETFNLSEVYLNENLCNIHELSASMSDTDNVISVFNSYMQSEDTTQWLYSYDKSLTSKKLLVDVQQDIPQMVSNIDSTNDSYSTYYIYSFNNTTSDGLSLRVIDKTSKENIAYAQAYIKEYGSSDTINDVIYDNPECFVTARFGTDMYNVYYTQNDVTLINNNSKCAIQLNNNDQFSIQTNDLKSYTIPMNIESYLNTSE